MALKLMYITNNPEVAEIVDRTGVDWVFIDLEVKGKNERQGHLDTVKSNHAISDIAVVKKVLKNAKLLVRINPVDNDTKNEIEGVIAAGADIIMLPYYKTIQEVETFIEQVDGRVKTCLLCETPEAVDILDETINIPGIDYIHIGLNDLHLGYGMSFMFEPLANGIVAEICSKLEATGIKYGFGGIARLGEGMLSAEMIIAEHYRLGSDMAILSRTFCHLDKVKDNAEIESIFKTGIAEIRDYEKTLKSKSEEWLEENRKEVKKKVNYIVSAISK